MNTQKKIIGLVILVVIGLAVGYAYKEYTRKPADLSSVEPAEKTNAENLIALFESDESSANKRYLGKPIEVSGAIVELKNQRDTLVNVLLGKADDLHRVSCLLDSKQIGQLKQFKVGDSITLRGICTGYLIDVELNRCVIIR